MSIRRRLTLWYSLALLLALLAFTAVVLVGSRLILQYTTDRDLLLAARQLGQAANSGAEAVAIDTGYRLLSPDGAIIRASGPLIGQTPIDPAALAVASRGRVSRETVALPAGVRALAPRLRPQSARVITIPVGQPVRYILQVARVNDDVQRLRQLMLVTLLIALAVGLPLAALGGWWLAGRALAPLRAMTEAAERIQASNLADRLPSGSDDELGRLAATFNGLLNRLEAAFERERRFTADVSHDLRTPLAVLKSSIGVALNRPRDATQLRQTLTEVDRQVDQLAGLLEATLLLARADADRLARDKEPVDLTELLSDLSETTASYAAEEYDQVVTANIAPGLSVKGDRDLLTRLFLNLVDNAVQYTPHGGAIRVDARVEPTPAQPGARRKSGRPTAENSIIVEVTDTGAGIAPEQLPHIFDRFYRADAARVQAGAGAAPRTSGHHGLGLSIAQAIAHAHGGEITATSALGRGSVFRVRLPLWPAA